MDAYLGEIRIFAGNFAPRGWAFCNGQLLSIAQNSILFSLLGTTYGGDGRTNFALPDLRGRAPIHQGAGTGLHQRDLGAQGGVSNITLSQAEMPAHHHAAAGSSAASDNTPANTVWATAGGRGSTPIYNATPDSMMNQAAIGATGGDQAHNNMQPYLGINFIIALEGEFPQRS